MYMYAIGCCLVAKDHSIMDTRIILLFTCMLILIKDGVSDDRLDEADQHCKFIEISNSWWHRGLEGVYRMKKPDSYVCYNRTVYEQDRHYGENYLYFVKLHGWAGWMIGLQQCLNKGYLSVGDSSYYPDEINSTWEEYNSMKWILNKDVISGCHIPGVTRPPRIPYKTKPSKPDIATITIPPGTSTVIPDRTPMTLVLYVVTPIGCIVILVLVTILCTLAITQKSFLSRQQNARKGHKSTQVDAVHFSGDSLSDHVTVMTASPSVDIETVIDHVPGDQDSVYEILTEPVDAIIHLQEVNNTPTNNQLPSNNIHPPEYEERM